MKGQGKKKNKKGGRIKKGRGGMPGMGGFGDVFNFSDMNGMLE